jgi:hypothetical protein
VPVLTVETLIACNMLQKHESLHYIDHKNFTPEFLKCKKVKRLKIDVKKGRLYIYIYTYIY